MSSRTLRTFSFFTGLELIRAIALFLEVVSRAIVEGQSGGQDVDVPFEEDEENSSADESDESPAEEFKASEEPAAEEAEAGDEW